VGVEMLCYMVAHEAHQSRAGVHACASAWISSAGAVMAGYLELGEELEGVRGVGGPGG